MRIEQTGEVIEILCAKIGRRGMSAPTNRLILDTSRIPYVKYSTGANGTTRTEYCALGKPNQTARPKGVRATDDVTAKRTA